MIEVHWQFTGCAALTAHGAQEQPCGRTKTCAGVGRSVTRHTSCAPEEMLASPPQKKVDAHELNPAEFDDGHESGLNTVAE